MKCLSFQPYFVDSDLIVVAAESEGNCKKIETIFENSGTRMSGTLESAWILSTSHDPGIVLFITRTRPKTRVFCEGSTFAPQAAEWGAKLEPSQNAPKFYSMFSTCFPGTI